MRTKHQTYHVYFLFLLEKQCTRIPLHKTTKLTYIMTNHNNVYKRITNYYFKIKETSTTNLQNTKEVVCYIHLHVEHN